jgi:hypothetical protein
VALGDAYASVPNTKDAIDQTSSEEDLEFARVLLAISHGFIDNKLGRTLGFCKDDEDVVRYYTVKAPSRSGRPRRDDWAESENPWLYGGMTRILDIDDHVSITSVAYATTTESTFTAVTVGDYELLPRNAASLPVPEPYRQVVLTGRGTLAAWPNGARVKVTGVGGWPSVPPGIEEATIQLASMVMNKSPFSTNVIQLLDQDREISPQARSVLNGLYKYYVNPAVYV